ncbi:MAG TPA: F0F1 ATP synthase subunit A [Armatimonadota bacterium]|nr:F0F1 ATP synthase subunit A [Armatimonadota bacterium]
MEHHEGSALVEGSPFVLVYMSWAVIIALTLIAYLGTRKLKKVPGPLQNLLEMAGSSLYNFVEGVIGPEGRKYAPFLATLFFYISIMNIMGLIPFLRAPTSGLNMTIALALTAFGYVQLQAIRANGFWGYIKHFMGEPLWLAPLMFPIHVIGELAKPLSLSLRLFGNVFGEEKIIVILAGLSPFIIQPWLKVVPIHFPMVVFAVFTSVIQALIFTILTAGYITVLISHEQEEEVREAPVSAGPQ